MLETLAEHSLIIYIKIPASLEQTIIERAQSDPKPLYYRPAFVDEKLSEFLSIKGYQTTDEINPDEFVTWVFPKLFHSRLPRYEAIAKQYGYTINAEDVAKVTHEQDFIALVAEAIARQE